MDVSRISVSKNKKETKQHTIIGSSKCLKEFKFCALTKCI